MALQKVPVPITLTGGIDTKTDEKLVLPTKLTILENGVFTKSGTISKRNGYRSLSKSILGSTSLLTTGSALATYNNELLMFDNSTLRAWSQTNESWLTKGIVSNVLVENSSVVRNSAQQTDPDMAVLNNIAVYVWNDSRGGVRASVIDEQSGTLLQSDVSISSTGANPRVVVANHTFLILYSIASTIRVKSISSADLLTVSSETTIVADLNATTNHFDAVSIGNAAIFAYSTVGNNIIVGYLLESRDVGSALNGYPAVITKSENAEKSISVFVDIATQRIYIAYFNTSAGLKYFVVDNALTTIFAPTVLDSTLSPNVITITGCLDSSSNFVVFYEFTNATSTKHYVKTNSVSNSNIVGTSSVLKRSVGIASRAFLYNGNVYLNLVHDSTLQSTYFLTSSSGYVVSRIQPTVAGGLAAVPSSVVNVDGDYWFAIGVKTKFVSDDNTTYTLKGISKAILKFEDERTHRAVQIGKNSLITGGTIYSYDGVSPVEHGFHVFPEDVTAVAGTSAGLMSDGTYQYAVCYEWTDNAGQVHKSAPSIPTTIVLNAGSSVQKVTLTIPTLRLTQKTSPRSEVSLGVYRTENLGAIFYRVSSISSPTYNDPTADSVSFVDTLADTTIVSHELLYTTGGVLENIAPPSSGLIAIHKKRAILVPSEDPYSMWISRESVDGEGLAFSDSLIYRVDPKLGAITKNASLDDKIIIFKSSGIDYMAGDGPADTGVNDTFTQPQPITSDVGCTDPNSVVVTPQGLMFKSSKGIYLLTRDLQVMYIGADVEAYNSSKVTGASLMHSTNQVRFTLENNSALIYDYHFNQWGTFTGLAAQDSLVWNGSFVFLKTDGTVMQETEGYFLDDTLNIKLKIGTSWIKAAGLQGYQRVYRVHVLGDYRSSHVLRMSVGYDYEDSFPGNYSFLASTLFGSVYYGQLPYGDDIVYGGVIDGVYQFRAHLKRQKCQSIRFIFEDIIANNPGESYSISGIQLLVGVKAADNKVRPAKSI